MRVLIVLIALILVAGTAIAQEPSPEPFGDLAEVMRGILFPNANLIFDAQTKDPGAPPEEVSGNSVTATFSSIYTGWEVVENAAIALAEASNLITLPGRLCENGNPVPVERDAWQEYVVGLREAGQKVYQAALAKSQDQVIEATNDVAGACENCHFVYRDSGDKPRCTP